MEKGRKTHTIARRSMRSMILFSVLLVIGTCGAAGTLLFRKYVDLYKQNAFAFAHVLSTNINAGSIEGYLETGEKDDEYDRIELLTLTAALFADFRYVYVVVPTEDDLIYIWDTTNFLIGSDEEEEEDEPAGFLEHDSYSAGEKEVLMRIMEGNWKPELLIDMNYHDREALATVFSPVLDEENNTIAVVGVDVSLVTAIRSLLHICLNIFLAVTLIMAFGMILYYRVISKGVIQPIVKLKKATQDIVGNLDEEKSFKVDIHTGDEIEALASSFEEMDTDLKRYVRENNAITAEKQRLSTELDLARRIQTDMLPAVFPPFPDRTDFDIYAAMRPAREVGGDFYDFFLTDDDHLGLVMADVSGKGIPAALFMMMTRIMIRNFTMAGLSPKEVLETVNEQICQTNNEEMFVTVWLGILDLKTGVIRAVNAGHEYPVISGPDASFELVKDKHSFVVGGMEGIRYREYELKLSPGSLLFLYTDGVPEATDMSGKLFGTGRMLAVLNEETAGRTLSGILETMENEVDVFAGEAPQFDDMTMMCIAYYGKHGPDISAEENEEGKDIKNEI